MAPGECSQISILVPTRDRPRELRRLLCFLHLAGNQFPVHILDGSAAEAQAQNERAANAYSFARYETYGSTSHMGVRCFHGLQKVSTPYAVFCADDDFVFPAGLAECVRFLEAHADVSAALGRVYSLSYFRKKSFFKNGILLDDSLRFIGFMAHERFLQRALYYFAYTYLGSTPLFYGVKRTEVAREAFRHTTDTMKYSGVELLSNTVALIHGKVTVLDTPFGLRDYSTPTIASPIRHDPQTYLAKADLDYMRPIFARMLAQREDMPLARAEEHIDLYLTQWVPPDWQGLWSGAVPVGLRDKLRLAARLMRSMYAPGRLAREFRLPPETVRALMTAHRIFVSES